MKKIISFALTLALLVSVFAALPVLAASTRLLGYDVTLTEGISLNFYIEADTEENITNATATTQNGTSCYKETVNLGAKNMGDALTAQLMSGNLSVGDKYTASVKDYADAILGLTYDKATIAIVEAMLGYGAAAQKYWEYNVDKLVGTPVTDTSALKAATAPDVSVTDPNGIYVGASLVLEGDLNLRFYFRGNGLNITMDGKALATTDKGDFCYADVAVMPNELAKPVTVCCGDASVTYSALNYLKSMMSKAKLSEMVASIYAYGTAAEEYVRVSGCDHEGVTFDNAVQLPTIFNGGLNEGTCPECGGTITETVGKTEADVKKYNAIYSPDNSKIDGTDNLGDENLRGSYSNGINIVNDILAGGKHFYPDAENGGAGRDLYVEFSFLYNETLKNNVKGYIDIFRIEVEEGQGAHPTTQKHYQGHTFYFLNLKNNATGQWCPYEGGFETGDIDKSAGGDNGIISGPTMPNHATTSGESEKDYVFIGEYGWHRMGIRVHQEAKISGSKVVYTVETSFYIDGVCVSQYYTDLIDSSYNDLLYTAEIKNGKLVYSDIEDHRNFLFYKIRETYATDTFFVATADEYATAVTVGEYANPKDGFLLDVERIENPTYEEFKADGGITLDGTRHFKVKGELPVSAPESKNDSGKKLLLISVDGLRPDAIEKAEDEYYFNKLKEMGSYTLSAQTIYPSKTMPAHMSMFHSVSPSVHGMDGKEYESANIYAPSKDLGLGMTEVLAKEGYTASMFFDWENMQYLTKVENTVERNYIQWYRGENERYHERSTIELTNAILEHIENDPTDFTYLYFGMTDQMGHDHAWLSDEYYIAIDHIFSNIMRILEAVSDEYTVIITTDHGGGGDLGIKNHGSAAAVDMTTPVFIIGEGFEAGRDLGEDRNGVSILDIAPTVLDVLGLSPEEYWEGESLAFDTPLSVKLATEIFLSEDSWSNYSYGAIKSKTTGDGSITVELKGDDMTGLQLSKSAIYEMMSLGLRYLSFTVELEAGSFGITPSYVDIYTYKGNEEKLFFVSSCDSQHTGYNEFYYASGREITIDLWGLYAGLTTDHGLIFVLSNGLYWQPTKGGSITFSNVKFTNPKPDTTEDDHVLLVSLDGLRPDALSESNAFEILKKMGAYTLSAQTINPSITLPAHMSMFHSVTPTTHGVTTNNSGKSSSLGNGITETLAEAGLTSALFYDWEELKDLTTAPAGVERTYVTPDSLYKSSVAKLSNAVLDHVENSPTDFTFLFYGHTDAVGESENGGWVDEHTGEITDEYRAAIDYVFASIFTILNSLPDNYTVIITTDHGGGGYNGYNRHGSTAPADMTTPVIIIGDGFEAGASLGEGVSILDIAPTVVDLLGVEAEDYWVGRSLAPDNDQAALNSALDIFFSEDAWDDYNYGGISATTVSDNSITMELYGHAQSGEDYGISSLQLNRYAVSEMIALGFRYLSFTVELEAASSGITPKYVDLYTYDGAEESAFLISSCDAKHPNYYEFYYKNGREIKIDLWGLQSCLTDKYGWGLMFVLSGDLYWEGTHGGSITFSNVELTASAPKREDMALDVFFDNGNTWGQYTDHGKVTSFDKNGNSFTIGVGKKSTDFAGMQLNKAAVGEMISLGYRYLSFTMNYAAGSGKNPNYACVYYWKNSTVNQVKLDFLGYPNNDDHYYANGETITIDLWGLYNVLNDGDGLVFILTTKASWSSSTATTDGYFIFSNVKLTTELD